jgi:CubicO group peptidase (beta-lactamase class C family)
MILRLSSTTVFVALTLCSAPIAAFPAPAAVQDAPAKVEPALAERLALLEREIEAARISMHVPGLALVIVRDDAVIYAKGFGLADVEKKLPVTPETIFAIGSSTKAFTATLVGMLMDEGKLDWDAPVTDVLPEFVLPIRTDDPKAVVTFRDLLSHNTGFARADLLWAGNRADPELMLATIVKAEPWKGFREEFLYNNIMFVAAGHAAGKVAGGKTWSELVSERILKPLEMSSTTTSISQAQKDPRLALGYEWDVDLEVFERQPMRALDSAGAAGALNSTVLDMAQWVRLQLGGGEFEGRRLIEADTLRETWKVQRKIGGGMDYGLGWFLREWQGQPVVEHGGSIDGFGAQVGLLPDSNLGFVLLTNVTATPLQGASLNMVWEALLGQPKAQKAEPADHSAYIGDYLANFATFKDVTFEVLEQDGKLAVDVPGQMVFTLKPPNEEGKWYFEITDQIAVSFDRDDAGQVIGMKMYQSGLTFELPREGVETPIEIDLEDAKRFLGRYQDPKMEEPLTVVIQNNRLAVEVPKQMTFELHAPDAERKRVVRGFSKIAVRFVEDVNGAVTAFTLFTDDEERLCPRVEDAGAPTKISLDELHVLRASDKRKSAVAAMGAWRMVGKAKMVHMGITGRVTIDAEGTDRYVSHTDLEPFATLHVGYDRGLAASVSTLGPYKEEIGATRERMRLDHPAAAFGDWREFYREITVLRADERAGRKVWVVKLSGAEKFDVTVWVDAETGDTLREDFLQPLPGGVGSLPRTHRYADFREVEGMRFPHHMEVEDEATGRTDLEVESLETHLDLPDEAFRVPQK